MHRPYPSRTRALRQLDRHGRTGPARPLTPGEERLIQGFRTFSENLRRAQPSGAQLIAALANRGTPA